MTADRDALAQIIQEATNYRLAYWEAGEVADAILAAGWRPMPPNPIDVKPGRVLVNGREMQLKDDRAHRVDTRYGFVPWGEDGALIHSGWATVDCICGFSVTCANTDVDRTITEHLFRTDDAVDR